MGKDVLLQAVWPSRIVEENNLTVHMTALRKVLNNSDQRIIRTVTGRGYVFTGVQAETSARPADNRYTRSHAPAHLPLPAQTLIGREATLAELRELVRRRRIVTVVGPGGVGKTILVLHVASQLAPDFDDGVAFIDLSLVTDPLLSPRGGGRPARQWLRRQQCS